MIEPYYQDDSCTIYHADCRDVLPELPKVDLVLTDPPYELSDSPPGKSHYGMSLKKFEGNDFAAITVGFNFNVVFPLLNIEKFNCFCFCSNRQISKLMTWSENNGFITTLLIWNKINAAPFANGVWRGDIEYCVHMREKGAIFQGNAELKKKVFRHPIVMDNSHPSVKPLKLLRKYIEIGSNPGSTILDPFMGSGTTLRAAKDLGRKAIGIEIEEKYCEIAVNRLRQEVLAL
jgi:site-specific DNA-methyltransferase (adenine-specific)